MISSASDPTPNQHRTKDGPTPGPWEVVRHHHADGDLWLSVNQSAIPPSGMKEWIAEIKYLSTEPERQWANARLIAAAPDLLAAMKRLHARAVQEIPDPIDVDEIARAASAIAKAEGR